MHVFEHLQAGISNIDNSYDNDSQILTCRFSHVSGLVSVSGNTAVKDLSQGNSYFLLLSISVDITSSKLRVLIILYIM